MPGDNDDMQRTRHACTHTHTLTYTHTHARTHTHIYIERERSGGEEPDLNNRSHWPLSTRSREYYIFQYQYQSVVVDRLIASTTISDAQLSTVTSKCNLVTVIVSKRVFVKQNNTYTYHNTHSSM